MIKGKKREALTAEAILSRISEYDIYRYYFGEFKINELTKNHLRGDKNPSFIIGNKNGNLRHWDFADPYWRGDCFSFVRQVKKCDYDTALRIIDLDFGLGIVTGKETLKRFEITSKYEQPQKIKRYAFIQVIVRNFTKEELSYWNSYHIDINDLKENNVYSVKAVYLNRKKVPIKDTELRFGYFYDGHWKIYRPFASKTLKWFPNNVPINVLDGKENIINCDTAFINKSKKDMMVVKKIYPCSMAVQNESFACFSEENVKFIKENSRRQVLSFDADAPGVKNSIEITKMFGFDYCNVPKKYLNEGIKDWADLAKAYGLDKVKECLTLKNVVL